MKLTMDKPVKVWVQATQSCNLACRVCYGDCTPAPSPDELTTAEVKALVDRFEAEGVLHVLYEGGEPLLRPDLFELLEYTAPRMMCWLRTNATLVDAAIAERLADAKVATVVVDVFGATARTHDALTGVAGSFDRSVAGIRHLVNAGHELVMALILTRQNAHELADYVSLAADLGVPRVGILRLYPLGRARRNWADLALSLEEQTAALRTAQPVPGVRVMQSWHPNDSNCCWQNAAVDAKGNSIGCPYLRDFVNYGNVRQVDFYDTWDHPLYRTLRSGEVEEHCDDCAASEQTRGGCRATAYAFTGNWLAPDPFCSETNKEVDLRVLPV